MLRFLGVVGAVLFLFGMASYLLTADFDLWTAIHFTGGGILLALSAILEFAKLRRALRAPAFARGLAGAAGTLLFAAILVLVNLTADRLDWRYDATERRIHTLGSWSREAVASLPSDVEILAFLEPGDSLLDATRALLERYAALGKRVRWEWIDPVARPELAQRYDVSRGGVLVARAGEAWARAVLDPMRGIDEGVVTPLLLRATDPSPPVVAFTAGHGEADPFVLDDPRAAGVLSRALALDNVPVSRILPERPVPDDVAVVVVAGPTRPLPEEAVEHLADHVAAGKAALVLTDVGRSTGLEDWLARYGLSAGDDVVVDPGVSRWGSSALGLDPVVEDFDSEHPALAEFRGPVLFPRVRTVGLDATVLPPGTDGRILAWTSRQAWAETSLGAVLAGQRPEPGPDERRGPLPLATSVETPGGARIVLAGDSDFVRNAHVVSFENLDFARRLVRWLNGRDDPAPPEPRLLRSSRLDLTSAGLRNLFRLAVLLYPEALLVIGLGVWWWRRSL